MGPDLDPSCLEGLIADHKSCHKQIPGSVAQSVMCLATDTFLTADSRVVSLILVRPGVKEIDHEIISTVILQPSPDSRMVAVSYKRKYVHEILVNYLVKLAQEKSVVRLTDHPNMTIAVDWDIKNQTKLKATSK